ncbi:hypothetical protein [Rhodococcus qingshengii]|uniref:hypothetical protein n=1 Tax=Rhodococcus qingshengii TaxID=334542 RepID=UPI0035DCF609
MSEIRSQAAPARDELAEAIKGYGKSFLGECEEVDLAKIEHSFDCMADGLADYLTEDAGWSKPRTVTSAAELDGLPVGSVVHSAAGTIAAKLDRTEGVVFGIHRSFQWSGLALPATVLFTPGEAG